MSGRFLDTTLLLVLASFPALGLLLTHAAGPFGGAGWAALLATTLLGALALAAAAWRRDWSDLVGPGPDDVAGATGTRDAGVWVWLLRALPIVALLPVAGAVLGSVRIQISHHGFFHSAYVYQVLAGHVPPENVTLPGHASNTYWPYHALLAGLVALLSIPAPLASAWLNLALLAGSLGWAYVLVRELYGGVRPGFGPLLALFALFGGNLLAALHVLLLATAGVALEPRAMVLLGDVRLGTLLAKFANYTGASLGVYFYVVVLLVAVRVLRGRARGFDLVLGGLALLGAFALHAITGAFVLAGFPPAMAAAAGLVAWLGPAAGEASPRPSLAALRQPLSSVAGRRAAAVALLALAVLTAPVLVFMANASSEFPEPPRIGLPDAFALSVIAVSYPVLPLFVAGVVRALRRRDAAVVFLALVCLGGYALASVVSISGRNEYKFIYLGTIALCLVALEPMTAVLRAGASGRRPAVRVLAAVALLLACVNVALFGVALLRSPGFTDDTFAYMERHVVARPQAMAPPGTGLEFHDVFEWIRAHTDADTVVVVPLLLRDRSALYVLSERVPYVVDGLHYNRGLPDFARRAGLVTALYERGADPGQRVAALTEIRASLPARPLVLVWPHRLAKSFDPASAGLARLHRGRVADAYAFPDERGAAS
jgi:hypothetical protein